MFLLIGYVVILLASLGTYAVHGSLGALWVPMEYLAIVGLTIGGFIAGNGSKAIKVTLAALPGALKGGKYNKASYIDVLALLFEILAKVRKEGLMSIESDIENPEASPIFSKYPNIVADHHVVEFMVDYLRMMVGGNLNAFEIENLMDIEIDTHHVEAHMPASVMSKVADGVPAFGIVVAVMGVVNVMGVGRRTTCCIRQDDRGCAGGHLPGDSSFLRVRRPCCQPVGTKIRGGQQDLPMH